MKAIGSLVLCLVASALSFAAVSPCLPDGTQPGGAKYRICMPAPGSYNGKLVIFAHGYVDAGQPVGIPEDQLVLPDGTSLPSLVNGLGYGFAVTSYRVNGLAVVPALQDLSELIEIFKTTVGAPTKTYLVGPSEGGIVTALAVEKNPWLYNAGLAACGPVGSFRGQIDYIGDFRVVFDYFFPGLIPGTPDNIPAEVITNWDTVYVPAILAAVANNPGKVAQILAVTGAARGLDPSTVESTFVDVLWYNTFTANDAVSKLGGQPFGNRTRVYKGSNNDILLNLGVKRFDASPAALASITQGYQTSGQLVKPLVTMHTLGDQIIPYWHEPIYQSRIESLGNGALHTNIPVLRYGHCQFKALEILIGFAVMVLKESGQMLPVGSELLLPADQRVEFQEKARAVGVIR